jgi:nucleotide-binding universal stress UspA family protein
MSPTIIAAARGEDAHDAIALATVLARIHDARVLVAGVYVLPAGQHAYADEHAERAALHDELTRLSADVPGDVEFDIVMKAALNPIDGLRRLADEHHAVAIVLGPTHLGATSRALRGDVSMELLADAPCAIAVAPHGYGAVRHEPPQHIGVAWNPSDEARAALAMGADLARRTHGRLRLVHVVPPAGHDETVDARVAAAAAEVAADPAPEAVILEGLPAEELARAGAGLDLLLAGSRSRGAVRRTLLGSVTAGLVHRLPCAVLILPRSAGFPARVRGPVRSPERAEAANVKP